MVRVLMRSCCFNISGADALAGTLMGAGVIVAAVILQLWFDVRLLLLLLTLLLSALPAARLTSRTHERKPDPI